MISASDHGESAHNLEVVQRTVAAGRPQVRFGGHTQSGARIGEYAFRSVDGRSCVGSGSAGTDRPAPGLDRAEGEWN